jgi:hypothetical protein
MSPEELARKQADIERRERELQAQAEKLRLKKHAAKRLMLNT